MNINDYKTNEKKEVEGVWMKLALDCEVKLARMGNKKYERYLSKLQKPYLRQIRKGTISDEVAEELGAKALAKFILLDWKNMQDGNDKEVPYSEEKAIEYLMIKDFADEIITLSSNMHSYQDVKDDSVKN